MCPQHHMPYPVVGELLESAAAPSPVTLGSHIDGLHSCDAVGSRELSMQAWVTPRVRSPLDRRL